MNPIEPQAERLQSALDQLAQGEAMDDVLARLARHDALEEGGDPVDGELADLVALGAHLAEVLPERAPASFRARGQVELQSLMATPARRPGWSVPLRWLPHVLASVLAIAVVAFSAVAASADSLPGQPLYRVKLAVEDVQLVMTTSPHSRAALRIDLVHTRLTEIRRLIDMGVALDVGLIEGLIGAQHAAAEAALATGDAGMLAEASAAASEGAQVLASAKDGATIDVRQSVDRAIEELSESGGSSSTADAPLFVDVATATVVLPVDVPTLTEVPTASPAPTLALPTATNPATETPASSAVATSAPSASSPSTATHIPTIAAATLAATPSDTAEPLPTLAKAADRAQTLTAEAGPRATPTRRPPWRPGQGHGLPPAPSPVVPTATVTTEPAVDPGSPGAPAPVTP